MPIMFAIVFYERKHLSCFVYLMTFCLAFVPAPPNAVYTVQNFLFSPAVILYIFAPHVGSVSSMT